LDYILKDHPPLRPIDGRQEPSRLGGSPAQVYGQRARHRDQVQLSAQEMADLAEKRSALRRGTIEATKL